jgi:phage replication-related protein YjqB (UPF0714/DUF867 family)
MLAELLATDGVEERVVLAGPIGIMAIHGGLESHTETVATRVAAASGASLYAIVQPPDHRWHIPSIRHDPRASDAMTRFLEHVRLAVSIHGFGRHDLPHSVLVGGTHRELGSRIGEALRRRTDLHIVDDLDAIPSSLRGLHPANPVNLPELGGVQIELSPGAREPATMGSVVDALASVVRGESGSVCATA